MTAIKGGGRVVLGIDDHRQHCRLGAQRAQDSIEQKRRPQLPAPETLIDRKPANQRRRQHRIARQAAGVVIRQVMDGNAGGGQRVIARHRRRAVRQRDKAVGHAPPHILTGLAFEIAVERLYAG